MLGVVKAPISAPSTRRWEVLETTPATTAPRVLKGSSVYTTKTTNRKKGTCTQRRHERGHHAAPAQGSAGVTPQPRPVGMALEA